MAQTELVVDVHHHYMPAVLFDRLAAQAGGKRIVTKEISLTLHPSRKDLDSHLQTMDEAGVTVVDSYRSGSSHGSGSGSGVK